MSAMLNDMAYYRKVKKLMLTSSQKSALGYPPNDSTSKRGYALQNGNIRTCSRCFKPYRVNEHGFSAAASESCHYHPMHKRMIFGRRLFPCCNRILDIDGCYPCETHVSVQPYPLKLEEYQTTQPHSDGDQRSYKVFAVDCEMCFTTHGLQLCKVTAVDRNLAMAYDAIVKPSNPVVDYNQRITGISREMIMSRGVDLATVRDNLLQLWNAKTILVGHGLDGDLHALKIIHERVVDTIMVFPHHGGLPFRRSLRDLAKQYLGKNIQPDLSSHDSLEDAKTCMELVQWKI